MIAVLIFSTHAHVCYITVWCTDAIFFSLTAWILRFWKLYVIAILHPLIQWSKYKLVSAEQGNLVGFNAVSLLKASKLLSGKQKVK